MKKPNPLSADFPVRRRGASELLSDVIRLGGVVFLGSLEHSCVVNVFFGKREKYYPSLSKPPKRTRFDQRV
jgi:hypothetical protein